MTSPQKRSQRSARRELRSDAIAESSSPTRPSKRRKKADELPAEPPAESTEATNPAEPAEEENSELVGDQSAIEDDDHLVTQVTQTLLAPHGPVHASRDYANTIHENQKEGVQAYAKIAAADWTYFITKLVVNIGRSSEPLQSRAENQAESDEDAVHIDLGPSKLISRQHASVFFHREEEKWWLRCKGRNSLKVDGHAWTAGQQGPLRSGQVIEIGGIEMMFVLPSETGSSLQIHDQYLIRAGILKKEESAPPLPRTRHPLPSLGEGYAPQTSPQRGSSRSGQGTAQKPLAPAPPDYKRPGTPPSVRRALTAQGSPRVEQLAAGPVMMNNSEIDLSLDENSHIKPQYSYAQMITQAITNTPEEKLNLAGIYAFIMSRYSYYRKQAAAGWQNSIRHNLSLNKAFEKIARSTDEPGKGMKWQLVPETREEMIRLAYRGGRGGHRGSSNPSSPSQLSYINQGPRDMGARDTPGSVRSKRKVVSPSGSPQPRSALRDSHQTPVRPTRRPLPDEAGAGADGSPLPRLRKTNAASTLGMVENAPGSPTLTSSYLQEDGASFITPAPHRVHPKLAPPSTAQRPSQHMPTSSPAPFWKYADIGSTPLKPPAQPFDLSPTKGGVSNLPPASSSPPPTRSKSPVPVSPTRTTRAEVEDPSPIEAEDDHGGFDLTKGFQSIGSYHAPAGHGKQVQPATNGDLTASGSA
ncbi:fork head domain-containing protein [Apodospora peruviana]|uniref:Fork head domain-containing protein n=1 Tax=Apodospora peruviana TaxID=516989 RepID=A0AAE0HV72_9PEZI|nr:fork head domain-containing protein [Apodospora peruviana]